MISELTLRIYRKLKAENPGRKVEYIGGKFVVDDAESPEHQNAREKIQEQIHNVDMDGGD